MKMAMHDSMPKFANINAELHSQVLATINTGGAAKFVSVPPIEILTKRTPRVANIKVTEGLFLYTRSRNKNAAKVIAAGSVISDPNRGVMDRVKK